MEIGKALLLNYTEYARYALGRTSMRLFIGIKFESTIRTKLVDIQNQLRAGTLKGNFTHEGNLHLTVEFLGELPSSRLPAIQAAMRKVEVPRFELVFDQVGSFRRAGKDIVWLGVRHNPNLQKLQGDLAAALRQKDFKLENRPYTPHLTLARQVVFRDGPSRNRSLGKIPAVGVQVRSISLMNSERVDGELTYTELFAHPLPSPAID
ncbi:MAG: RNA 2',3'-cyclic phosphodiesterase [Spirochaetae bacterium HGW-Spirochaetae-8]|nr:MAG: RNA 2',3'-cyclic phosphodiesterase [Spirochaetae bacterium HGW-Spirochaetae-8]